MSHTPDQRIADMEGQMALPRQNGELLFETPWEARAFGMAVALNDSGVYMWRDFSQGLAAETAAAERHGIASSYYERWLETLEKIIIAKGLMTPQELDQRTAAYVSGLHDDHHGHHHTPLTADGE